MKNSGEAIKSGEPVEVDRIECRPEKRAISVISARTYPLLSPVGVLSGVVMVLRDDTMWPTSKASSKNTGSSTAS